MSNPWFRMYVDFLTDYKMISLAFEDQRHFIGVLALKSSGILDQPSSDAIMNRIVSQRLWIDHSLILDVKKRLVDAGLIDDKWQPLAWSKRQYKSDFNMTGAERQKNFRERQRTGFDKQMQAQDYRCDCCDEPFKTPYNKYVVMDHNHSTKENRGLVCQSCNRVIGQIENREHCVSEKKQLAESYLVKHSVTLRNGSVTLLDTDTDTDTDIKSNVKGTRLWPTWFLTQEYIDAALAIRAIDMDELRRIGDEFRDYWIAVPGSKGVKLDWLATWRNWVRRTKTTAAVTVKKNNYFDN